MKGDRSISVVREENQVNLQFQRYHHPKRREKKDKKNIKNTVVSINTQGPALDQVNDLVLAGEKNDQDQEKSTLRTEANPQNPLSNQNCIRSICRIASELF